MKKPIIAMATIAAALLALSFSSCGEEQLTGQGTNATEGSCIVTASTESPFTKTALSGNDTDGYEVFWSEGDAFKLGGETFTLVEGAGTASGTFEGIIHLTNGWHTAYYPVSYDGSSWPAEQTYTEGNITGSPMKADVYCIMGTVEGGKVEFKNVGGILRLTVKGTARLKQISVYTDSLPVITLDCGDGADLDNTNGTVFHIAMPAGDYSGTSLLFATTDHRFCVKTLKSDKTLVISRSEITPVALAIDNWTDNSSAPDGALPKTFTVSEDGRKVYFSRGNLYYDGLDFGFASSQLSPEPDEFSHFYWSRNASQACAGEYNEYLSASSDDVLFTNGDYDTPHPEFTANGQTGLWRALTEAEWRYLAANSSVWASIKGVNGLVIFCDGYTGSRTGTFSDIPDGCVFLPADGEEGTYLTSEPYSNSYGEHAWMLYFNPLNTTTGIVERQRSASYIRLATDVSDHPALTVTFDANGHGTAPAAITDATYHATIDRPADPAAAGYTFWGWYKDEACTAKWDFDSDLVTSSTTLYARWKIDGALPSTFTVNDSGKKVSFAKGNLWYGKTSEDAESATFNFEANQYDYSAIYNKYKEYYIRDGNHVSHFMWSGNAAVACAETFDDPSANESDVFFTNATQTTPNPNFTANGQKGMWRILSPDEWAYLAGHNGHAWASINGVGGRIIFCDGYSGEKEGEFTEIPEGCLFLPAAGSRYGAKSSTLILERINNPGEKGNYWTSIPCEGTFSPSWFEGRTYSLFFNSSSLDPQDLYSNWRASACSVRLVTER